MNRGINVVQNFTLCVPFHVAITQWTAGVAIAADGQFFKVPFQLPTDAVTSLNMSWGPLDPFHMFHGLADRQDGQTGSLLCHVNNRTIHDFYWARWRFCDVHVFRGLI